jgi:hypothetical protein
MILEWATERLGARVLKIENAIVECSCEHGNEQSRITTGKEFPHQLSAYWYQEGLYSIDLIKIIIQIISRSMTFWRSEPRLEDKNIES